MKMLSRLVVLAVLLSLASLAPLQAEEAPVFSIGQAEATPAALPGCVRFYCPIYPDNTCGCEWVWCEQFQTFECGQPKVTAATTTASASCGALMTPAS